jgi:polyphosphate kinase
MYNNRDLSWLQFNSRVLQEAQDLNNPIIERVRFLGIFSKNLDEFFRVRVATIQRLSKLSETKKIKRQSGNWEPKILLNRIQEVITKQNKEVESTYSELMSSLNEIGINLIKETELTDGQKDFIRKFYIEKISPSVFTMVLDPKRSFPELNDESIYLSIRLISETGNPICSIIEIPTELHGRFIVLPKYGKSYIMYIDDVLRYNLRYAYFIFPTDDIEAHSFKISRDSELDIDQHDISKKTILDRVRTGLEDRLEGDPVRISFDRSMKIEDLKDLTDRIGISGNDSFYPGGRYHNKKDLINFPNIGGAELEYPILKPKSHPDLDLDRSILNVIRNKDVLLFTPYHTFLYIIRFLREVAMDPQVKRIHITLYRLANQSRVISALINAAKNGKIVNVVIELQARFDEKKNIHYLEKMRKEGILVQTGIEGLKVHSKLICIERVFENKIEFFSIIGTGNFNEISANTYTDYYLMTSRKKITKEVIRVFEYLAEPYKAQKFKHLIVSPNFTRDKIIDAIDREIKNAKSGLDSGIWMKFNSLSSYAMIDKLYEASCAGVKIKLIVRGICSIIPGVKDLSENIEVISILDRYLEHSRVYAFSNNGDWNMYISSFDLMTRNLDLRIEVGVPIYDKNIKSQIKDHLDILWKDNVKSRLNGIDESKSYRHIAGPKIRSQIRLHKYVADQLKNGLKK